MKQSNQHRFLMTMIGLKTDRTALAKMLSMIDPHCQCQGISWVRYGSSKNNMIPIEEDIMNYFLYLLWHSMTRWSDTKLIELCWCCEPANPYWSLNWGELCSLWISPTSWRHMYQSGNSNVSLNWSLQWAFWKGKTRKTSSWIGHTCINMEFWQQFPPSN